MDPSNKEGMPAGRRTTPASGVTSPTDTTRSSRFDGATARDGEGYGESFQSTDTVRHRPEGAGYGTAFLRGYGVTLVVSFANSLFLQEPFRAIRGQAVKLRAPTFHKSDRKRKELLSHRGLVSERRIESSLYPGCASRRCRGAPLLRHPTVAPSFQPKMMPMKSRRMRPSAKVAMLRGGGQCRQLP